MKLIEPIPITDAVLSSSNVAETDYPAWSAATAYALGNRVILTALHKIYEAVKATTTSVVTISSASPTVVSWAGHGLADGTPISFSTTGNLPTPMVPGVTYYVRNPTADNFNLATTPGGTAFGAGASGGIQTATAQSNYNRSPDANPTFWLEVSATNRWMMFDPQNNTQTSNAGSISVTLLPVNIVNGVYVGNVDADSVTVTVTDAIEGAVYNSTQDLLQSNSGSSFFNWCFKRITRKTAAWFTDLPMYVNATVQITLTKSSGNAKCGMCAIGQVVDIGMTATGVQTDIKDYSTTIFNSDGTSETTKRGYAKRMSVDVVVDNNEKDAIENQLASYRQAPMVWIASTRFETTTIYGTYSSFKTVIDTFPKSRMSLQIEGTV
jgi:hypothetical protein